MGYSGALLLPRPTVVVSPLLALLAAIADVAAFVIKATGGTLRAATLVPSALRVRASAQAVLGDAAGAWASLEEGLAASAAVSRQIEVQDVPE